jgi:hypothetical protein
MMNGIFFNTNPATLVQTPTPILGEGFVIVQGLWEGYSTWIILAGAIGGGYLLLRKPASAAPVGGYRKRRKRRSRR